MALQKILINDSGQVALDKIFNSDTYLLNLIQNLIITPAQTTFIQNVPGKNLFNPADAAVQLGYYINEFNGAATANASFNASGKIYVTAGAQYVFNHLIRSIAFYTAGNVYVSGLTSQALGAPFTVPATTAYLRFSEATGTWANTQIEAGTVVTAYAAFVLLKVLQTTTEDLYANALTTSAFNTIVTAVNAALSITNAQLAAGAVTWDKTNFLQGVPGKNLFNPAAPGVILGSYVLSTDGTIHVGAGYNVSDFIPVVAGTTYTLSLKNQIAWYNASKVYISGSPASDGVKQQVAPAGAAYLRATCTTAAYATFQIEIGTTQTAYAAYTILKVLQTTTEDYYANAATPALVASLITAISSGLSVTTSAIADAAVTPPKTTFFVVGKNKFNINSAGNVLGSYINYTNGNPTVNASFNATDYIPVVAGTTYTFSAKHQMAWYNAAKVYISGSNSTDTVKQQTAPAGAAFVRSSVTLANWSTFQVEVGAVQTAFEAYSFYLQSTDGTPLVVPGVALDINTLQALFAINRERAALVAVAPVLYTLLNKEIAIGYAALLKYYDDYKGKTDIVITGAKITGRNAKLLPTATGTVPYSINIYNEQFNQIVTKAGNIIVSNPATVTPVKILLEGDSYTLKGDFTNVLMASAGATGVTWLGIRNTASATVTINAEGRGGYTLARYLTLWKETTLYSPFMQPTGNTYKYFGVTGYWKIVNGAGGYDWDNYPPAIKSLFDTSTGYLIAPTTDSVMYDDVAAKFYNWSGGAWVEIAEATLNFTFNFAKYRATWGIAAPDIFHSLMGTNDFASMSETDIITYWPTWRANMDTVIASIKADTAGCKIIIGIPNAPGKQLPDGALVNEKRNRAFWYHASMIVTTYGNRTAENLYIADYHTVVDREYGFANADEKPFNDYSGAYRDQWKADTVHLSPDGFLQMGNLFAGLIQALR